MFAKTKRLREVAASCLALRSKPGEVREIGLTTHRNPKGVTPCRVTPWFDELRGADLNRRPLGYERFSNRDWSQGARNNAS